MASTRPEQTSTRGRCWRPRLASGRTASWKEAKADPPAVKRAPRVSPSGEKAPSHQDAREAWATSGCARAVRGEHRDDHARASGREQEQAGPSRDDRKEDTQMVSVAASSGTAICCAPSRIATVSGAHVAVRWRCISDLDVASSTSMPIGERDGRHRHEVERLAGEERGRRAPPDGERNAGHH